MCPWPHNCFSMLAFEGMLVAAILFLPMLPQAALQGGNRSSKIDKASPNHGKSRKVGTQICHAPHLEPPGRFEWPDMQCQQLKRACLDQNVIVVHDRDMISASPYGDRVPRWLTEGVQEFQRLYQLPEHREPVYGISYEFPKFQLRLATEDELRKGHRRYFSNCTLPIVISQHWLLNWGEFMSRSVAVLHWVMDVLKTPLLDRNATVVLATTANLPLAPFNRFLLQPFSKYPIVSLAQFSSRQRPYTPSNHTAEGRHVRCFSQLVACRLAQGMYPHMYTAGQVIYKHYEPQLPQVRDTFWTSGPSTLKVLFELRTGANGTRQILNLHEIVQQCNTRRSWDLQSSSYQTVECRAHQFGKDLLQDVAVSRLADIFVAMHGAGSQNALFMQLHSSVVELRPYQLGTKHMYFVSNWWPEMSSQMKFQLLVWFLNVDEPDYWTPGTYERVKTPREPYQNADIAARDRNIRLRIEWMEYTFRQVVSVNRDVIQYKERWDNDTVAWTFANGTVTFAQSKPRPG